MMWDGYGWGGAGAWFMLLFMIVFIAAIVVGIVLLVRALGTGTGAGTGREEPRSRRDDAREILRRRYAAGEIDREEYLRRRQDLDDDS
jgi:putative membrane protein